MEPMIPSSLIQHNASGGYELPLEYMSTSTTNRRTFLEQAFGRVAAMTALGVGLDAHGAAGGGNAASPKNVVVDSHQHFWDPAALKLPPNPPEAAVLNRAFLPADLEREIKPLGINYTVLVQGYPQTDEANRWLFEQSNSADFVKGVVAWVDLQKPDQAGRALEELKKQPKFVGIRHIVQDEPDVNWIVREPVLESFKELARHKIPYDMVIKPQHLRNVLKVANRVPQLSIVIDHIAKPDIAAGGSPGWAETLTAVAQSPKVYCKLSGMVTEADHHKWKPSDLTPYVHHATEAFGWDRVMYGSDWPVCLLAASYRQVWDALHEALGAISEEQRRKVFGANAVRFYGLKV
jgi:L-fuconolactonase